MELDEDIKLSIREVFEGTDYYGRSLTDSEVQEIADNLVSFGESLLKFVKNRENRSKNEPEVV